MFHRLALVLAVAGLAATGGAQTGGPCGLTPANQALPSNLLLPAAMTGQTFSLEWDGCNKYCFQPTTGAGGQSIPPQWGGADLTGWKITSLPPDQMPGAGLEGYTELSADPQHPFFKTIVVSNSLAFSKLPRFVYIVTHEMLHVALNSHFPEFDAAYGTCVCFPCDRKSFYSHPGCFPCFHAIEQTVACTAAQSLCCALSDPELSDEQRELLEDALAAAKKECADALALFPNAWEGCPVPATSKPSKPENAPETCPPLDCPTEAMQELEGEGG